MPEATLGNGPRYQGTLRYSPANSTPFHSNWPKSYVFDAKCIKRFRQSGTEKGQFISIDSSPINRTLRQ